MARVQPHKPVKRKGRSRFGLDKNLCRKWVQKLISGKYIQGDGALRTVEVIKDPKKDTFCCLGVMCDVINPKYWREREDANREQALEWGTPSGQPSASVLPIPQMKQAGLDYEITGWYFNEPSRRDTIQNCLVTANDGIAVPGQDYKKRFTFNQIAQLVCHLAEIRVPAKLKK